jgi:hypothetical protein
MVIKYSNYPLNIPNGQKNISTFSNLRPYLFFLNWDFLFENKPSGNPVETPLEKNFNPISGRH